MKTFFLIGLFLTSLSVAAQEFKPFKVNASLGYTRMVGKELSNGFLAALEPKYGIGDYFDLGFRIELAGANRILLLNGQSQKSELKAFGSYLLTGNVYLTRSNFRPYIGVGAGYYNYAGNTYDMETDTEEYRLEASGKFGTMLRVGFKAGHWVVAGEYNLVAPSEYEIRGQTIKGKNSYLAVKLGFDIGGGRK